MFAPRVFISMIGALSIFAIVTFILTGSAWTTAWQTLVCAVLVQAGYFIAVLVLVAKEGRDRRSAAQRQSPVSTSASDDKEPKTLRVPNNPGHLNS